MFSPQDRQRGLGCSGGHHSTFPSDPVLFQALELHAQKIPCEDDRVLFDKGDRPVGVYLVRSGTVQAIIHSDVGGIAAIFHANAGTVLGLPAIASNRPYSLSAVARQGSDVALVAKGEFERIVRDEPGMYMAVLRVLASEVHAAREALANS